MKISLHRTGVIGRTVIALSLGLCGATQAGMQVQALPQPRQTEPSPKVAPASVPAASKPPTAASTAPSPAQRPDEKIAWSPCIKLINAAALGAASDIEQRQALLDHCAP